jgi:hypothetical protein
VSRGNFKKYTKNFSVAESANFKRGKHFAKNALKLPIGGDSRVRGIQFEAERKTSGVAI